MTIDNRNDWRASCRQAVDKMAQRRSPRCALLHPFPNSPLTCESGFMTVLPSVSYATGGFSYVVGIKRQKPGKQYMINYSWQRFAMLTRREFLQLCMTATAGISLADLIGRGPGRAGFRPGGQAAGHLAGAWLLHR